MAELTPKELSDLTPITVIGAGTLLYVCPEDEYTTSGYDSNYITAMDLFSSFLDDLQFPLLLTATTSKKVAGAINELATSMPKYTDVTGTLSMGSTTITLSDAAILETSTIDIYTDNAQVSPENAVVATGGGSIVLTFEAQESALGVKVRVWA